MYVYKYLFFLCITGFTFTLLSNHFDVALEAQKKNEYQQACDAYCAMPVKTGNSMFNRGVIAYHEKLYPKAIALWRTACTLTTVLNGYQMMHRVFFVIEQVKKEQEVPTDWAGHPADSKNICYHILFLLIWYSHSIPLWIVQCLFMLISVGMAALLCGAFHKRINKKRAWYGTLFFGILVSVFLQIIKVRTASYAITQESVQLRRGPGDFFESVGELSPLVELLIEAKTSLWYKVRYQDTVGWVPEQALYVIDDHVACGITIVNRSEHY